jgi:N6-L-threonylcarbamoyladenine synthase
MTILYFIQRKNRKSNFVDENLNDICASIQHTIIEILMDRIKVSSPRARIITQILYWRRFRQILAFEKAKETEKKYGLENLIPEI